MSIRAFSAKARKTLQKASSHFSLKTGMSVNIHFWVRMFRIGEETLDLHSDVVDVGVGVPEFNGTRVRWVALDTSNLSRDLTWWGIEDKSLIAMYVES
jgi:hypothetical protein